MKELLDLDEASWISLPTNSFPDPAGPKIKIRLSVFENFSIEFRNFTSVDEFPINSFDKYKFFFKDLFSFFKDEFSSALLTKFNNLSLLKGFSKNSKAPCFIESTAI